MIKSFLQLSAKYKKIAWPIIGSILPIAIGIWTFNFQNLLPDGTLTAERLWQIRIVLTLILPSLYLLSFLILFLYDHKKEREKIESESIKAFDLSEFK